MSGMHFLTVCVELRTVECIGVGVYPYIVNNMCDRGSGEDGACMTAVSRTEIS